MGRKALAVQMDVTDRSQLAETVGQVADAFGGHIDILMNNAGHLVGRSPVAEKTDEPGCKRSMSI